MMSSELVREYERQMKALRIGDTPLKRCGKIEKRLGIRRLHVKLEGANPTGTHKDRMALMIALDARRKGLDTVAAATCGNYGVALLKVCDRLGMNCIIYIPTEYEGIRNAEIADAGGQLVRIEGSYEAAIRICSEDCARNSWHDANPGGENKEASIYSYTFIAKEIAQSLGRRPDWVSVPVGNGTILAGVWQGFLAIGMKPHMLGTSNNNAAIRGMVSKEYMPKVVPDISLTHVNDPLAGNFLPDAEDAIRAMLDSNGAGMEISDEEMVSASQMFLEEENLEILPASASTLAGIMRLETKSHTFVPIATARGDVGSARRQRQRAIGV
ncbi:MAG: pyridoxal-phosphate dependent enzyme [Methanobacteriota archaeon]|nr:MAG: pyridoxal-phosphate dependent enzyme [Euryarchaeota archaeon]